MLLAVDIGNSKTALALFQEGIVVARVRRPTSENPEEPWLELIQSEFGHRVDAIVLGSVVPAAIGAFRRAASSIGVPLTVIDASNVPVAMRGPVPGEVGPDRLINIVAARQRLVAPFLVIDIGTATTFDAVASDGVFVGGAIAPGPGTAAEALHARTARLPRIELVAPARAIGITTRSAMQSGAVIGYAGLVDGLARRIKAELAPAGPGVPCIATGGLAALFGPLCREIDSVELDLTLHGLRLCMEPT